MSSKKVYEIYNASVGDAQAYDKYLIAPPNGETDFPVVDMKIPVSAKGFSSVVLGDKVDEVGGNEIFEDNDWP